MKLFPETASERLGFTHILQELIRSSETEEVKQHFREIKPVHDPGIIRAELMRTAAWMRLLQAGELMSGQVFREITPWLKKAAPGNSFLTQDEMFRVGMWLKGIRSVLNFLEQRREKVPELCELIPEIPAPSKLTDLIFRNISDEGFIRDDASPELMRIRRALVDTGFKVRRLMEKIHRQARDQGWSDEKQVTIRNNRLVIPLISDFKGKVEGFVQDVSQSGQTIFIEPAEALQFNNEIAELTLKERNEIYRILLMLTEEVRKYMPELRVWEKFMQTLEFIQAKAKLSIRLNSEIPEIEASGDHLRIVNGRNPALCLQKNISVVPMNMELDRNIRILVISGPNAGGKSVALKTAGLLQLMVQCGIPVPAEKSSVFPVLASVFVDLGDGQSIENDLSTYTAHLSNMRYLLEHAHESSLFLIDEFGTGTDPRSGGPIAVAILEALIQRGAYGVITTHYSDLKQFARKQSAVMNASMHFDLSSFSPTYRLETGNAGSSYAFEIARRAGISEKILKRGKYFMGAAPAEAEELLAAVNKDKAEMDRLREETRKLKLEAETLLKKLYADEKMAKEKARKVLSDAREEARRLVSDASRKIGEMVTEVREKQIEKKVAKSLQKDLLKLVPELVPEELGTSEIIPEYTENLKKDPEPGDTVRWLSTGAVGRVLESEGQRFVVAFGEMRTSLKRGEIICLENHSVRDQPLTGLSRPAVQQKMTATTILDIRGQRAEPAREMLLKFLDDAQLHGLPFLHIIHGKGNGILRKITLEVLKQIPGIERWEEASPERGGAGATDVYIR